MNNMPVFTIVVPVYKVEAYLDKCIQSLINQTYQDIEIILVDDGSQDRCPELCDRYAKNDRRIKVIHQKNAGLSKARNAGVEVAQGKYILFVDSDDYIEIDACEKLLPYTQTNCDIIVGDGVSEGGVKRLQHGNFTPGQKICGKEYLKTACQRGSMPMAAWLYVYRKTFLNENTLRFKKGILHEDEQFTPRAFLAAKHVVESGVIFYHYLIRENSITTQKDLRKNAIDLFETCVELNEIYEALEDTQLKKLLIDSLAVKYLSLFQQGKLYQYGSDYLHKSFICRSARRGKTKCKALLFSVSPRLYWQIHHFVKQRQ